MLLDKKICIVTGAARGIGRQIAEQFAAEGAKVYACDLHGSDFSWLSDISDIIPQCVEVTNIDASKQLLTEIFRTEGRIDVLVNNAAVISNRRIGMITRADLQLMFSVNAIAVIEWIQLVSRIMSRNGGGSIVNIASVTGVVGSPGQVAYSATKGAVITATKSAAKELAPLNIRVNAVAPGIVRTERFEELYESDGMKIDERIGKIGLGRLATPEDIASACVFLASDKAGYISGQILGVDGCATI